MDIAHEVRLAREAEAEMDLHVAKAGEKAEKEISKHSEERNVDNAANSPEVPLYNTSTPKNHWMWNFIFRYIYLSFQCLILKTVFCFLIFYLVSTF